MKAASSTPAPTSQNASIQRAWVVRNLDPWYGAFGAKPGEKLYLDPAKRVRVW